MNLLAMMRSVGQQKGFVPEKMNSVECRAYLWRREWSVMFKLPKSVVLEGRRYPTWVLSQRARDQIVNLQQVDAYIEEINERLAYLVNAREVCRQHLREALSAGHRMGHCYWQTVTKEWAKQHSECASPFLLRSMPGAERYRAGDTLLVYVKGCGVFGWGKVVLDDLSTQRYFEWQDRVPGLIDAIPSKALGEFGLRHPTRVSQRIVEKEKIEILIDRLMSLSA